MIERPLAAEFGRARALPVEANAAPVAAGRPGALARFDQLYMLYLAVSLAGMFKAFPAMRAITEQGPPGAITPLSFEQYVTQLAFMFLILAAMWFFVSRMRSRIALWLLTIDAANSVLGAFVIPGPIVRADLVLWGLSMLSAALNVAACSGLHTAEARAWFKAKRQR